MRPELRYILVSDETYEAAIEEEEEEDIFAAMVAGAIPDLMTMYVVAGVAAAEEYARVHGYL